VTNNQTNIQLRKNGTTQIVIAQTQILSGSGYAQTLDAIIYFNGSTDYIELTAFTGNPTSQGINSAGSGTWIEASLIVGGGTSGTSGSTGTSGSSGTTGTSGTSGITGPQGSQGPLGPQGFTGPQGAIGPQGITGPQGTGGSSGTAGTSGSSGTAGTSGSSGTAGTSGSAGTSGGIGPQGVQGPIGPQGNVGPQGVGGPQGNTGPAGTSGSSGTAGTSGTLGPQGNQGPQGVQGPGGSSGTSGTLGPQGNQGPQGPAGPQGSTGPQGPTGPQGSTGPQGPAGPQGLQGPSGSSGTSGNSGSSGTSGGQGPGGSSGTSGTSPANQVSGTGTSGQVTFWTGTTTQAGDNNLFWNNTDKRLGIGTVDPSNKLTVYQGGGIRVTGVTNGTYIELSGDLPGYAANAYGVIKSGGTIHFANNGKYSGYIEGSDTYFGILNSSQVAKVTLHTNGASYFTGGNVGIGTSTPGTLLHVEGATVSYGQIRFLNTSASGEASIQIGRTAQTAEQRWTVGQGVAGIGDSFGFYTGGSSKFTLTTAGAGTFVGNISAANFSGSSSGTNTGDQDLSGYVTLAGTQTITGKKTFSNAFGDSDPIVAFVGTSAASFQYATTAYNASLSAGHTIAHFIGRAGSSRMSAYLGYQYAAADSNSNFLTLGHWGYDHLIKLYPTGQTIISGNVSAANLSGTNTGDQDLSGYVTLTGTQTITGQKTISRVASTYGGTTQSFLIDGAGGNGALTINATLDYAYLSFAQAGVTKFEIGAEGAATNKGSLYINHNIQVGSTGAAVFIKKSNGYVGINQINPSYQLQVNTDANEGIYLKGSGSGVWMNIQTTGKLWSIGAQTDGMGIYQRTDSAYALFIKDNGFLSIGNGTTATYKFNVFTDSDVWHAAFGSSTGQLRIGGATSDGAVIQSYTPAGVTRALYLQRDGSYAVFGGTTATTYGGFTNTKVGIKQLADGGSGGGLHIEAAANENVAFFGFTGSAFRIGTSYRNTGSYQPIEFSTTGATRMYIGTDGRIGIGNTGPGALMHVSGRNYAATMTDYTAALHIRGAFYGGPRLQIYGLDSDSNAHMGLGTDMGAGSYELSIFTSNYAGYGVIRFGRYDGTVGQFAGWTSTGLISTGGTLTMSGDVVAYGSPSDIKFKENVKPFEGSSLERLIKLRGVSFTWKEDTEMRKLTKLKDDIGFIAQEVQEIFPEIVRRDPVEDYLSIRDRGLIAHMVEAIKEQQVIIATLEQRINSLEESK
jgi:hypothetical protein